ncbi:MAG: FtsW/RodA/SpoVE family cell cycle protein [Duncaniella sp.]|nr:FtsW/RodA/SpoVE family cell cycle protein [Duncaniella sp.]
MESTITSAASPAVSKPKAVGKSDKHIWGIMLMLCVVSVIELYSASSREVASSSIGVMGPLLRHLVMLAGGLGITWFIARRHFSNFVVATLVFASVSVAMMVYVMLFGDYINGARRSMTLLGIGIFPAECLKLSAVLMIALIMAACQNQGQTGISGKGVVYSGLVVVVFSGLLFTQGMTNTVLLVAISFSMLMIAGAKFKHLLMLAGAFLAAGAVAIGVLYMVDVKAAQLTPADGAQTTALTHRKVSRVETWIARLTRHSDNSVPRWELPATGENRQEVLSYMAQAHGGVFGVGPGNSREAARLPLAFSDYIYAIVVEELGLAGGIFVLLLYLWLLGRAAGIVSRCNATYPALLVLGMAVMIAFQALFHMAIVTGVGPVSGQPLPLISKGGTSILVTCIAFGIMLSVSRTATHKNSKNQDKRDELDTLPEQMSGTNMMQL